MSKDNFFERYAILSLVRFYNSDLKVMLSENENYEKPDFQSKDLGIGIEVTEAITTNQGEQRFIVNEYFGKGLDGVTIKEEAEKRFGKRIKGRIKVHDGFTEYREFDGMVNTSRYLDMAAISILEKTVKLNSLYEVFNANWLYVFIHTSILNVDDIKERSTEWFSDDKRNFDKIILNCIDKLFIVDNASKISVVSIDESGLRKLKADASSDD